MIIRTDRQWGPFTSTYTYSDLGIGGREYYLHVASTGDERGTGLGSLLVACMCMFVRCACSFRIRTKYHR